MELNLTGPQMRQHFDTYKAKYCRTKDFERNTGAGIEEEEGYSTLHHKLEAICPYFDHMDALFKDKPNVIPMSTFDSSASDEKDGIGNPIPLDKSQLSTNQTVLTGSEETPQAVFSCNISSSNVVFD
ncbi:hypothetical protein VP01_3585g2 [Puccinia sorghi]|uniref:Uncharacterized protein n=1 Tax=Puccinia sorghi TaxID=27349 RepID=A0A0L6UX49_9BASI|nr:hypothetical protein VP01_3585g2 [Puccinia sorghi]